MIKAIFRDFDGTIWDTLDLVIQSATLLAKKYHRKIIPSKVVFRTQSIRSIVKNMWIRTRQVPFFVRRIRKYIQKHQKEIKTFPGLKDICNQLSQTYINCIITTNRISTVKAFLYNNKFFQDAEVDNCGMRNKAKKIERMMVRNHLSANEVIYIGDEVRDIHSCKELWIKIIAVSRWYDNKELLQENKPTAIVHEPKEIFDAIKQLEDKEK